MPQIHELSTMSGNPATGTYLAVDNGNVTSKIDYTALAKAIVEQYKGSTLAGSAQSVQSAIDALNGSVGTGVGWHNSFWRGKYLGSSISAAQNTAIKNRTYDDLFVGDYWTINGVNWRIFAIDYYYNAGDTAFTKGNVLVLPDAPLYNHQMCWTETGAYVEGAANNITTGGYTNSHMYADNMNGGETDTKYGAAGLTQARTTAASAFGNHVATHRVICTNATADGKPSGWAWRDSDGVELLNEVQVYGTRAWGTGDQNGYEVGSQYMKLPGFNFVMPHVNPATGARFTCWLQDVGSALNFARVCINGYASHYYASYAHGVRPAVTLTYT